MGESPSPLKLFESSTQDLFPFSERASHKWLLARNMLINDPSRFNVAEVVLAAYLESFYSHRAETFTQHIKPCACFLHSMIIYDWLSSLAWCERGRRSEGSFLLTALPSEHLEDRWWLTAPLVLQRYCCVMRFFFSVVLACLFVLIWNLGRSVCFYWVSEAKNTLSPFANQSRAQAEQWDVIELDVPWRSLTIIEKSNKRKKRAI